MQDMEGNSSPYSSLKYNMETEILRPALLFFSFGERSEYNCNETSNQSSAAYQNDMIKYKLYKL